MLGLLATGLWFALDLTWEAPPECPSVDVVREEVETHSTLEHQGPDDLRVYGVVEARGVGHWVLTLETAVGKAAPDRRVIEGESCEVVTRAGILVVSLRLRDEGPPDPSTIPGTVPPSQRLPGVPASDPAAQEGAPPSEPRPMGVPEPAGAPRPMGVPEPAGAPRQHAPADGSVAAGVEARVDRRGDARALEQGRSHPPGQDAWAEGARPSTRTGGRGSRVAANLGGWLAATAGLAYGVLPGVGGAVRLEGGIEGRRFRVGAGIDVLPSRTFTNDDPPLTARFDLVVATASGCVVLRAGPVAFPLCGRVAAGGLRGRGREPLPDPETTWSPWVGLGAQVGVTWRVHPRVGLAAAVEGLFAPSQPRFVVGVPALPVWRSGPGGVRGWAGLEVHFASRSRKRGPG